MRRWPLAGCKMLKVMIVDEVEERAEVLRRALALAGYEVIAYMPSTG